MNKFQTLNSIDPENTATWKEKVFITFDMDWCSDEVLAYTLDIIEKFGLKATFFVTHNTPLLERMRKNPNIELGIHPNFNPLLNGEFRYGNNVDNVVAYYKNIVPEAVSVRSHSLTSNSRILDAFAKHGLKYESNTFIPFSASIPLKCWYHWNDELIRIPYSWADDAHFAYEWGWERQQFFRQTGVKVFAFHPILIFLNAENIHRYETSRDHHFDHKQLVAYQNETSFGIRDFLISLIEYKRS